jgi:cysteine rich repeat protein
MLCAGLLLASATQAALGQGIPPGRPSEVRAACTVDYLRFCRDVTPGGGRVIQCMKLHADKLSPRCFQAMTAWGLAAANAFKACLPDADRLCGHVPPGGGRGLACLMQNTDKLSQPCRDALAGQELFNDPPGRQNGKR